MTNKECFIKKIDELLNDCPDFFGQTDESEKALTYFHELKSGKVTKGSKEITETGMKILQFMQENFDKRKNIFKATDVAEGLFTSGKSVSGSMRKLVSDEYVSKVGKDPVVYSLTEKGKTFTLT